MKKKEVKTKPTSTKTKIRRNLKNLFKNVRHTKPTQIAGSKRSQDNKGDK